MATIKAYKPAWVKSNSTKWAWKHDEAWRKRALDYGDDPARRLALLTEAEQLYKAALAKEAEQEQ